MRTVAAVLALGLIILPPATPLRAQTPSMPPPPQAPPASAAAAQPSSGAAMAGAVAVNVFRIPGKTFLCGLGTLTAGGLMLLTFGTQYQSAGMVFREGCGGKWIVGPSDLWRNVDAPKAFTAGEGT